MIAVLSACAILIIAIVGIVTGLIADYADRIDVPTPKAPIIILRQPGRARRADQYRIMVSSRRLPGCISARPRRGARARVGGGRTRRPGDALPDIAKQRIARSPSRDLYRHARTGAISARPRCERRHDGIGLAEGAHPLENRALTAALCPAPLRHGWTRRRRVTTSRGLMELLLFLSAILTALTGGAIGVRAPDARMQQSSSAAAIAAVASVAPGPAVRVSPAYLALAEIPAFAAQSRLPHAAAPVVIATPMPLFRDKPRE